MFDGTLKQSPDEGAELARLRALYDGLLDHPPAGVTAGARADLAAMARIFDLEADRAAGEVWRDLRAVLTRQGGAADEVGGPPAVTGRLTVMVVEDDSGMAADPAELLTRAGHRVIGPFPDGATAMTAVGGHAIDLALLDINLADDPGGGVALAGTLKQSGVPVVFLSGDVAAAARHARLATALVLKPCSGREVLEGVARAMAGSAVAR